MTYMVGGKQYVAIAAESVLYTFALPLVQGRYSSNSAVLLTTTPSVI